MELMELKNVGAISNLDRCCTLSIVENPTDKQRYLRLKVGKSRLLLNAAQADELARALRAGRFELARYTSQGGNG